METSPRSKYGRKSNNESLSFEHDSLVNKIIIALSKENLGRFWSQPTGAAYRNGKLVRYGLVGCADITGILAGSGRRVEIEVKTGRAKQTDNQEFFESMIRMMGGIYYVARDTQETVDYIKSFSSVSRT